MRRGVLIFLISCLATLLFLVHSVWTLLTLLIYNGIDDAIRPDELTGNTPQLIPRIIHQTYKNASVPDIWQEAQQSCIALHPGWEYKFWTDESSEEFIAEEYPWFLDTFRGYEYNIERADAIRYFALEHYGGIYIDLDDGCNKSLEPLLSFPAWVRKTNPTGISNDAMGAVPGHPFFTRVIEELQDCDRNWFLPYVTVMGSTGPLFLSVMWRNWLSEGLNTGDGEDGGRIRILFKDEYMGLPSSFFTHHLGNSWHGYDVEFMFWMLHNWVLVTVICTIAGLSIIFAAWTLYSRFILSKHEVNNTRQGHLQHMPSWLQSKRHGYELVNRHEV